MRSILRGSLSFTGRDWENVSEDAKNLIRSMLQPRAEDRPTAEQNLGEDWDSVSRPMRGEGVLRCDSGDLTVRLGWLGLGGGGMQPILGSRTLQMFL